MKTLKIKKVSFPVAKKYLQQSKFRNQAVHIKENVKKIVGEWHCQTPKEKEQFKIFRETYLRLFPKFKIYSIDMFDITDNLWRDMFLDYYNQVIIYIDNR